MGRKKSTRPVASIADIQKAQDIIKEYNSILRDTYKVYGPKGSAYREYQELMLQGSAIKLTEGGLISYNRKHLQDPDIVNIIENVGNKIYTKTDVENTVKDQMKKVNDLRKSKGLPEITEYNIFDEIQGMAYARINITKNQRRMNYFSNASGEYAEANLLLDTNDILNAPSADASNEKKELFTNLQRMKQDIENGLATIRENHNANQYSTFYTLGKKMEYYKQLIDDYLSMI